jgi:4-hydroxybenzoate polyprenyltransferase
MGCIYNVPPIRSKDQPYVDVLSEAINNPLRMLAGWFIVTTVTIAPASLLLSYWMIGCYFMAAKRFAEYNDFERTGDDAARYRRSFAHYTSERLLVSIMFYASAAMLFFGAFIVRYRLELILSFPLVAVIMAMYLHLSFKPDSPVENPEKLYRERGLMAVLVVTVAVMALLLFVPSRQYWPSPTLTVIPWRNST